MIGFQGEPGAFSDAAARRFAPHDETRGFPTFDALFDALAIGAITSAAVPVENSIAGPITRSYDLLWQHDDLAAVAELALPIAMQLVGIPGASLAAITEVRSHPMALEQIYHFTNAHPNWRRVAVADTAGAVAEIMALRDPRLAAVASALAADLYGAQILARDIQDDAQNFTRFYHLKHAASVAGDCACVAFEIANRPSSLRDALSAFADRGLNLRSLVARPNNIDPFHYRFFVEVNAGPGDALATACAAIAGRTRIIGRFAVSSPR